MVVVKKNNYQERRNDLGQLNTGNYLKSRHGGFTHGEFEFRLGKSVPTLLDAMNILGSNIISNNTRCLSYQDENGNPEETQITRVLLENGTPLEKNDCYAVIIKVLGKNPSDKKLSWYSVKKFNTYFL